MAILAGSNTIKGNINNGMDVELALGLGKRLGRIYGSPIAVAMDGRTSNIMLKDALTAGMMAVGCDVHDLGMVPTFILQYYMAEHPEVRGGVTITASFAGPGLNGFRVMRSEGAEDPVFDDIDPEELRSQEIPCVPAPEVGQVSKIEDFTEGYICSVLSQVDTEIIKAARFKICLDCRNSSVAAIASNILMRLGVGCVTIGGNTSVMDTERMKKLGRTVLAQDADLGVAIEMDGDHCLFASSDGAPVSGDKSFAIIAKSVLSEKKGKVVLPINSTALMEDAVTKNGGLLMHCIVGESVVARKVKEYDAVLGGDVFGCLVMPEHAFGSDGLMAMVKMLECVAKNGPLSIQTAGLRDYFIARGSVKCPDEAIPEVMERIGELHKGEGVDTLDGVKVFRSRGWILARPSSIRGLIKVYAQSDDMGLSEQWVQETSEKISSLIPE